MNQEVEMLATYFELMNANGMSHVYREAIKAGILDALKEGPKTAYEVAETCQTDVRATRLVLDAIVAMRLVEQQDGRYSLGLLAMGLLGGNYRQLGDQYWAHLPKFLNSGLPWIRMDDAAQSEDHYKSQAAALAWMLEPAAEAAAEALKIGDELKGLSILDVGAGSAIWSLAMARRDEETTVTAVDWPAVLEVATEMAEVFELADRFDTIAGNYHKVDLPEAEFDLALLGNVTHLEMPEGNRELLKKVAHSLKPGGQVAILDVFPGMPEGDVNRTLYALGLALRTESGRVYTPDELESLLGDAGFTSPQLINMPVVPYAVGMMVATHT